MYSVPDISVSSFCYCGVVIVVVNVLHSFLPLLIVCFFSLCFVTTAKLLFSML